MPECDAAVHNVGTLQATNAEKTATLSIQAVSSIVRLLFITIYHSKKVYFLCIILIR